MHIYMNSSSRFYRKLVDYSKILLNSFLSLTNLVFNDWHFQRVKLKKDPSLIGEYLRNYFVFLRKIKSNEGVFNYCCRN